MVKYKLLKIIIMATKQLTWDELYDELSNLEKFDEEDIEEICEKGGWECGFCDSGIDDGITDDEDEEGDAYVLYASYDISNDDEEHHVLFYYGDCSRIIGDFEER